MIGSGDIFDVPTAVARLNTAGVDGIAIARGAMGNPWFFRDLRACLEGLPIPGPPSLDEQRQVILWHFRKVMELYQPDYRAVGYFRKFIVGYVKRHPFRKQALMALLGAKTSQQMIEGIEYWFRDRYAPNPPSGP